MVRQRYPWMCCLLHVSWHLRDILVYFPPLYTQCDGYLPTTLVSIIYQNSFVRARTALCGKHLERMHAITRIFFSKGKEEIVQRMIDIKHYFAKFDWYIIVFRLQSWSNHVYLRKLFELNLNPSVSYSFIIHILRLSY